MSLFRTAYSESDVARSRAEAWLAATSSRHARLDHRTAAGLHRVDLRLAQVDADYVVPFVRKAGCRHRAHIAQPEYADGWNHVNLLVPRPHEIKSSHRSQRIRPQLVFKHAGGIRRGSAEARR